MALAHALLDVSAVYLCITYVQNKLVVTAMAGELNKIVAILFLFFFAGHESCII